MTSKILLYYKFQPIADPDAVRLWQRDLCEGPVSYTHLRAHET